MTTQAMDVFSLRDSVVGEYKKFATSFTAIRAEDIRRQVEAIYAQDRYWPEPLIQINPNYKRTTTITSLVEGGTLDPLCAEIFRGAPISDGRRGDPLSLFKHQEQAIALASQRESFVVTTGTGSGKSLCFFIPIVNAILAERRRGEARRTRAIVIYPMNALANSQFEELDKFVKNAPGERPVTFDRYTGQDEEDERRRIAENPPDILLTNFVMLELLMTRQKDDDRRVIANCEGLRFLVLDEVHTYRGRQGADVALLVRRVRERLAPTGLQCIGTSATMASEGSLEDKNRVVARVASKLFSADIPESNVIVETLERVTDTDPWRLSERFIVALLRDGFGFESLQPVAPCAVGDHVYPIGHAALGGQVPVVIGPAALGLDAPVARVRRRRQKAQYVRRVPGVPERRRPRPVGPGDGRAHLARAA